MYRNDHSRRSKIEIFENGFLVSTPDGADRVMLADVRGVSAYKRDAITTDLICCDIETASPKGPMVRTIHEEMSGFHEVMAKLEELPGFYRYWREAVILPPFAQNFTILYRQNLDFNDIYAGTPSHGEKAAEQPEEDPEPKWLWPFVYAAIFIAVFLAAIIS